MRSFFVLSLALVSIALGGCSVSDPTTTSPDQTLPSQTERSYSSVPVGLPATGGASSPRAALISYARLFTSFETDNSSTTLERAIALGNRELAVLTLERYESAASIANTDASKRAGEAIAVDITRAGDTAASFVVVREGRYQPNGALVGTTSLKVYSAALERSRSGWLLTSWKVAS